MTSSILNLDKTL